MRRARMADGIEQRIDDLLLREPERLCGRAQARGIGRVEHDVLHLPCRVDRGSHRLDHVRQVDLLPCVASVAARDEAIAVAAPVVEQVVVARPVDVERRDRLVGRAHEDSRSAVAEEVLELAAGSRKALVGRRDEHARKPSRADRVRRGGERRRARAERGREVGRCDIRRLVGDGGDER